MTTPSPSWYGKVLWAGAGFALAAGIFRFADFPAPSEARPPAAPQATPAPAPRTDEAAESAERRPVCYLGVVVAQETVDVAAEIEGILDQVEVRVGDPVRRGQLLATLDTRMLRHQLEIERAALRNAEAQRLRNALEVERAEQEERRREALEDLLSREEREAARFDRQRAAADLEAAEAGVAQAEARITQLEATLRQSRILAPMDGTVAQRYLDPGTMVAPGTLLVRLISTGRYLARFAAPPEETGDLDVGTPVRVEVETLGRPFSATVAQLAPEIDPASQMIFIEAHIDVPLGGSRGEDAGDEALPPLPSGAVARVAVARPDGTPFASCLGPVPSFP